MEKAIEAIRALQVSRLQDYQVPVYAIVPRNGPVSFYSQQKRAFNLVSALRIEGRLPPGTKVGVVGAGLAGITASAAAHMLGCDVTLFEANEARFHQQHGNHTRYIHPNVVDWPRSVPMSPDTELPFLNWTAGDCATVIDEIEDQWAALKIKIKSPLTVEVVDFEEGEAYISSSKPFFYEKFQVVIITCGFGDEAKFGLDQRSYWSDEHWHQLLSTNGKTIFVSGTGDGGLIDSMRLALLKFDQGEILERVIVHKPLLEIREELINADREARSLLASGAKSSDDKQKQTRSEASRFLHSRYLKFGVSDRVPLLEIRRNYKAIILNSSLPTPLNVNSSIINRVIVHSLVERNAIQYARGDLIRFPGDTFARRVVLKRGASSEIPDADDTIIIDDVDHIVIRHGPLGALRSVLSRKAEEAYNSHSEKVDRIGQEEHLWHSLTFEPPIDFKPSQKIALNRAIKSQPGFESWLLELGVKVRSLYVGMTPDKSNAAYFVSVSVEDKEKLDAQSSTYRRTRIICRTDRNDSIARREIVRVGPITAPREEESVTNADGNAYSYEKCHIVSAWNLLRKGRPRKGRRSRVAVLAGKVDRLHPAFVGVDITENDPQTYISINPRSPSTADDHTTSIVGLIAGRCNKTGFVGVGYGTSIDVYDVTEERGMVSPSSVANAIHKAVSNRPQVILLPFGSLQPQLGIGTLVRYAQREGVCVVAPVGNWNSEDPVFPASFPECLAVCSLNDDDRKSAFSGFGDWVEIAAPGENIWSCGTNHRYISVTGTTYSAAIVSGIIALMYQIESSLAPQEVFHILKSTADPVDFVNPELCGKVGSGRVNAYRALSAIRRGRLF